MSIRSSSLKRRQARIVAQHAPITERIAAVREHHRDTRSARPRTVLRRRSRTPRMVTPARPRALPDQPRQLPASRTVP